MHHLFSRRGRTLSWAITVLLWAVLFTPLIISHGTLFPYQTGKAIAYRILVEIAGFLYLWLALIEPRARPKPNKLFWSVLSFGGVLLLTAIAGINPFRSFWGDLERMEGVFGILHGVLLFVIAYGMFSRKEDWTRFFAVSLSASFFVALYAFAQVDPSFRFFSVVEPKDVQPGSTLGYHSFVATYAIFQIFFGVFVILLEKGRRWRVFAASFSLLNVTLLMLTAIRGAQVGMLAALGMGIVLTVIFAVRNVNTRIILSVVLVAALAFFAGILALKDSPLLEKLPYAFQRMATISFDTPTGRTRLISLQISWQAFKERPILGWGQENFKPAYNKHFDPEHLTYEQSWFDRAHNKVAEVAVNTGAVGLVSYLAMFILAFVGIIRFLRARSIVSEQMLAVSVVMLGTAYFVQNLFLFDMPVSYVLFFSSLAFTEFVMNNEKSVEKSREKKLRWPEGQNVRSAGRRLVLVGAAILTVCVVVWGNWIPYRTAALGRESLEAKDPSQALAIYNRAMESGGFPAQEVTRAMTDALLISGEVRTKEWSSVFDKVREHSEMVLAEEYPDVPGLIRLGKLYNERGLSESQYLLSAERVLRRTIQLSPARPEGYYELGVTNLQRGNAEEGLKCFRDALKLNNRNPRAHWVLGLALASQKHFEEGLAELEAALAGEYNWDNDFDINNLTTVFTLMNQHGRLARFYEQVVEKHPARAQYRAALATAYAKSGAPVKAKEQILMAVQLDRRYEENAARFIQNLGL